jgi:membrane protease YdiL (CAAX protease family)
VGGPVFGPVTYRIRSVLPAEPTEYHQFWRTERYAWWKMAVGIVAVPVVAFVAMFVGSLVWVVIEYAVTGVMVQPDRLTPGGFLANNLMLALLIPVSLLAAWAMTGQRPRWLLSVVGRVRWGWAGRCLAVILPIWIVMNAVEWILTDTVSQLEWRPESLFLIIVILTTTVFQSAGEEFVLRGFGMRAIGSLIRPRVLSFVVATSVTGVVFVWMHGAGDPWLNAFYLLFAVCASVLTWRTGGLEAAVVLHAVNNLLAETVLPFVDIGDLFNREAGAGSPLVLINMAAILLGTGILLLVARVTKVQVSAAYPDGDPYEQQRAGGIAQ